MQKHGWIFKNFLLSEISQTQSYILWDSIFVTFWKTLNYSGRILWPPDAMPILWPSDVKKWLIGKDPDAGKDWRQEEKGTTEDEMVGWHHRLDGHEFEWAPGVGDEQGSLACCSP